MSQGNGIAAANSVKDANLSYDLKGKSEYFANFQKQQGRKFRSAYTFPNANQDIWIRWWYAAGGIDPDKNIELLTVPATETLQGMRNGTMELSDFRVESLTDANGNKGPGEVADLASWIGLQSASINSVARLKNLTAETGKKLTDALLSQLIRRFPTNVRPDAIFVNRAQLGFLQDDRATKVALNTSGKNGDTGGGAAYAPTPTNFEGIPLVVTDSILSTEPVA
jgi:hypothetical protein